MSQDLSREALIIMPKSGTYVRIGLYQFLLFNNARYDDSENYGATVGSPFPIKNKNKQYS